MGNYGLVPNIDILIGSIYRPGVRGVAWEPLFADLAIRVRIDRRTMLRF